jgi:hypothetical protein
MTPDTFTENLQEVIEDLTRKELQRPLFFAQRSAKPGRNALPKHPHKLIPQRP